MSCAGGLALSVGLSIIAPVCHTGAYGKVIGGLDAARSGISSVELGSGTSDFRAHLATTFAGSTFHSTNQLTSQFLSSVDVVVFGSVFGSTEPITPLSVGEQSALLSFVEAGGDALLFADNNLQFESASDSILNPFGVDSTGSIPGATNGHVTNPGHPVTNGPLGPVSAIHYASFPGWFGSLGTHAIELARLDANNQVSLAAIEPGALKPGSGAVVMFSDSSILNGSFVGSTVTLVDNALAFAGLRPCDLNGDGAVDAADAGIMFGDWGAQPGSTADKNRDGLVDAADAGILFAAWTGDSMLAVPEPTASCGLIFIATGLVARIAGWPIRQFSANVKARCGHSSSLGHHTTTPDGIGLCQQHSGDQLPGDRPL